MKCEELFYKKIACLHVLKSEAQLEGGSDYMFLKAGVQLEGGSEG